MVDTLTTVISRALSNLMTPKVEVPTAIERWAEIEFKKDSTYAVNFYKLYGHLPSSDQIR